MTAQLTTERLRLRQPHPADAASLAAGIGNPNVARRLNPVPLPYTDDMARDWIDSLPAEASPDDATFVIETDDGVIGGIGYRFELGYWLAEPHWGKGFATEACTALLDWIFSNSDIDRMGSAAHDDNPASLNVQRKLGFVVTGSSDKFSQARQCLVPHILTELTRSAYFGRRPQ